MIATENMYPSTAKVFKPGFTGNADMPYDFFLQRYNEAYVSETVAFCEVRSGELGAKQRRRTPRKSPPSCF